MSKIHFKPLKIIFLFAIILIPKSVLFSATLVDDWSFIDQDAEINYINSIYPNEDYSDLIKAAYSGDKVSQFKLSFLYVKKGNKTGNDIVFATNWMKKSAEQDYFPAMETLVKLSTEFGNHKVAYETANKILAIDKENALAKSAIACYHVFGFPQKIDRELAYRYAQETKELPTSKAVLSIFFTTGYFDIESDFNKAEKLAKEAINEKSYLGHIALMLFLSLKENYLIDKTRVRVEFETALKTAYSSTLYNPYIQFYHLLEKFKSNDEAQQEEALKELIAYKNRNPFANFYYGKILQKLNKHTEALDCFKELALDYFTLAIIETFKYSIGDYGTQYKDEELSKNMIKIGLEQGHNRFTEYFIDFFGEISFYKKFLNNKKSSKYITIPESSLKVIKERFYLIDYIKSLEANSLKRFANNGNSNLMLTYSFSKNISEDEKLKYLTASANCGNQIAQSILAYKYLNIDTNKAKYWVNKNQQIISDLQKDGKLNQIYDADTSNQSIAETYFCRTLSKLILSGDQIPDNVKNKIDGLKASWNLWHTSISLGGNWKDEIEWITLLEKENNDDLCEEIYKTCLLYIERTGDTDSINTSLTKIKEKLSKQKLEIIDKEENDLKKEKELIKKAIPLICIKKYLIPINNISR